MFCVICAVKLNMNICTASASLPHLCVWPSTTDCPTHKPSIVSWCPGPPFPSTAEASRADQLSVGRRKGTHSCSQADASTAACCPPSSRLAVHTLPHTTCPHSIHTCCTYRQNRPSQHAVHPAADWQFIPYPHTTCPHAIHIYCTYRQTRPSLHAVHRPSSSCYGCDAADLPRYPLRRDDRDVGFKTLLCNGEGQGGAGNGGERLRTCASVQLHTLRQAGEGQAKWHQKWQRGKRGNRRWKLHDKGAPELTKLLQLIGCQHCTVHNSRLDTTTAVFDVRTTPIATFCIQVSHSYGSP